MEVPAREDLGLTAIDEHTGVVGDAVEVAFDDPLHVQDGIALDELGRGRTTGPVIVKLDRLDPAPRALRYRADPKARRMGEATSRLSACVASRFSRVKLASTSRWVRAKRASPSTRSSRAASG